MLDAVFENSFAFCALTKRRSCNHVCVLLPFAALQPLSPEIFDELYGKVQEYYNGLDDRRSLLRARRQRVPDSQNSAEALQWAGEISSLLLPSRVHSRARFHVFVTGRLSCAPTASAAPPSNDGPAPTNLQVPQRGQISILPPILRLYSDLSLAIGGFRR